MKINHEYLKRLLQVFQDSDMPYINYDNFTQYGLDIDNELFFHLAILYDQQLIERMDGVEGCGLSHTQGSFDNMHYQNVDLRLKIGGHSLLEALSNEEIWQKLKNSFKDASLDTMVSVSKQLLEGYMKNKVRELL